MKALAIFLTMAVLLFLCLPVLAQGSDPITNKMVLLNDQQGEYPLGRFLDILEDPGGDLTIVEAASPDYASLYERSQSNVPNFGYTDSTFWLRLRLRNESKMTNLWLLESKFPNLNYLDLYIPLEVQGYLVKQTGALLPFETRDLPFYHVVFRIPLAPQAEQTFYLRVQSGSSMTLDFSLWQPEAFAINKINAILINGLFYGALLITLGYHLFLFFSLKEANYLYFCLVVLSAILFFSTYEGFSDQFLWPGLSQNKLALLGGTMSLFFISTLVFSDAFLEQKSRAPRFHRANLVFIGIWVLIILFLPFASFGFVTQITSPLILVTPVYAILAGIYIWRKEYSPARFFLVSWVGFLLGLVSAELVRSGVLISTPITERFYHAGFIWLGLMWSLALADRIKLLRRETENANRELVRGQNMLSQILEGMPLGVTVYGKERKPTFSNQRAIEILSNPERGIIPDISAGRTLPEAVDYFSFRLAGSDQGYPLEKLPVWQAFYGKSASVDDIEADLIDRRVPLEIWANPIKDEQGQVESVVAAFQDITERRQVQVELEQYRQQLEQLVNQRTEELSLANEHLHAENAERRHLEEILRLRLEWIVLLNQVNQRITSTHDLPEAYRKLTEMIMKLFQANGAFLAEIDAPSSVLKLLFHTCRDTAHPELGGLDIPLHNTGYTLRRFEQGRAIVFTRNQLSDWKGPLAEHFQHTESQNFIIISQHYGESLIGLLGLEFLETERLFSADEITLMEKICLDISQVREKARLMEQTQALIAAEERSRLARELHDSVTQMLFSISLLAEVLPRIWHRDPKSALTRLDKLRRLSRGALAEMRTLLLELRPFALIKTPLGDLLTQLAEAVTGRTALPFQLFIEQIPDLPEDVHIAFYRITQESLNNVVKHAQASQVSVSLSATTHTSDSILPWSGEVRLMVRDDGLGFSLVDERTNKMGLGIMRERAAAIGATLTVESQIGQGTTVTLTWSAPGGIEPV